MKYYSTLKMYKASNVTFNTETIEAYSYGWWKFVAIIEGKLIFNNYNYSPTTGNHQRKVRTILGSLGIKINLVIRIRDSISSADTIQDLLDKDDINSMNKFIEDEIKAITRNEKNKEKRLAKKMSEVSIEN